MLRIHHLNINSVTLLSLPLNNHLVVGPVKVTLNFNINIPKELDKTSPCLSKLVVGNIFA